MSRGDQPLGRTPRLSAPKPKHDLQETNKSPGTDLQVEPGAPVQITGSRDPGQVPPGDTLCQWPKARATTPRMDGDGNVDWQA